MSNSFKWTGGPTTSQQPPNVCNILNIFYMNDIIILQANIPVMVPITEVDISKIPIVNDYHTNWWLCKFFILFYCLMYTQSIRINIYYITLGVYNYYTVSFNKQNPVPKGGDQFCSEKGRGGNIFCFKKVGGLSVLFSQ